MIINESERIWKDAAVAKSLVYLAICLKGLRKTLKHLSE
jgi:hypothetical protein